MPGVKDNPIDPGWFEQVFGFSEAPLSASSTELPQALGTAAGDSRLAAARWRRQYTSTKTRFRFDDGVLHVRDTGASFHVGSFELASLEELYARRRALGGGSRSASASASAPPKLSFRHAAGAGAGDAQLEPGNAGAVFQVFSLFNCLETTPTSPPEEGVSRYAREATQGAVCAATCPAATVFRNYFVNGSGQAGGQQLDCLEGIAQVLGNNEQHLWTMSNGFCLPTKADTIPRLSRRLKFDKELAERARQQLQVGVHWDTEVLGGEHRVCQVFCSALPVGLVKRVKSTDWEPFAALVLRGAYEATLAAAALLSAQRAGTRVPVFLTLLGGGAFGNRQKWIMEAIEAALVKFRDEPLDVVLLHPKEVPKDRCWQELGFGREPEVISGVVKTLDHADLAGEMQRELQGLRASLCSRGAIAVDDVGAVLRRLDVNRDGVIDGDELESLVLWMDSCAGQVVKADADGNGTIHYTEFCAWLCDEDPAIVNRMLAAASLYDVR
mmetsp:Transcript_124598/g.398974  ORF Transcript_124598/g.398974 Transcript_124598/m.398974 type:complete len:498 (+) Transcript_124598:107-1600(+)